VASGERAEDLRQEFPGGRLPTAVLKLNVKQVQQLFRAGVSNAALARQHLIVRTSVRRILNIEKVTSNGLSSSAERIQPTQRPFVPRVRRAISLRWVC